MSSDEHVFRNAGGSSYTYLGIMASLYVCIIVVLFLKIPSTFRLLKSLAISAVGLLLVVLLAYKFGSHLAFVVYATTVSNVCFLLFILIGVSPLRDVYVRIKTILADESIYSATPLPMHSEVSIDITGPNMTEEAANDPSSPQKVSHQASIGRAKLLRNPAVQAKLNEAFETRMRRYKRWQWTEFAVWYIEALGIV